MGEQTNYKRFRLDLYLNEDHPVDAAIISYLLAHKAGRQRNAEVRAALALYVSTLSDDAPVSIEPAHPVKQTEHIKQSVKPDVSEATLSQVLERLDALTRQVDQMKEQMADAEHPDMRQKIEPPSDSQTSIVKEQTNPVQEEISSSGIDAGTNIYPAEQTAETKEQEQSIMDISDDVLEFIQSL